jgi:hypothetical protein
MPCKDDTLSKMIDVGLCGSLRRFRPELLESDGDGEKELDNAEGQVFVLFLVFYEFLQWSVIPRLLDGDFGGARTWTSSQMWLHSLVAHSSRSPTIDTEWKTFPRRDRLVIAVVRRAIVKRGGRGQTVR